MARLTDAPLPVVQNVVLQNMSWETYEPLSDEHVDACNPRFAYDRGMLQIMVTGFEHEGINRLIADIFGIVTEEMGIDYINATSTTFKLKALSRGFEPDTAFYVRNVESVRRKTRIDLALDPPPDL
jgi:Uma2 family endonuclease